MSPNATIINNLIDAHIRNYAPEAFKDFNLNRILKLLNQLADAAAGGGVIAGQSRYTSANFIDPGTGRKTDVIDVLLDGLTYSLFWNQGQRYLEMDQGEFSYLPGGGFRVLLGGFDASTDTNQFYATIL